MSSAYQLLPNYTYDDYIQWKGRWEIVNGIAYAMSPMPAPKHQLISSNLSYIMKQALNGNKCHCKVYQPLDLRMKDNTTLNPDLLIICKEITEKYVDFPPELVVEIHSPSTIDYDKITKFDLYEGFGIKYYMMIDPEKETITIYILNEDGKYELLSPPYEFMFGEGCNVAVDFEELFT